MNEDTAPSAPTAGCRREPSIEESSSRSCETRTLPPVARTGAAHVAEEELRERLRQEFWDRVTEQTRLALQAPMSPRLKRRATGGNR